jgi:hypothetical protein
MLGHSSAAMTLDTYADLFDDDLVRVGSALDEAHTRSTTTGTSGPVWFLPNAPVTVECRAHA